MSAHKDTDAPRGLDSEDPSLPPLPSLTAATAALLRGREEDGDTTAAATPEVLHPTGLVTGVPIDAVSHVTETATPDPQELEPLPEAVDVRVPPRPPLPAIPAQPSLPPLPGEDPVIAAERRAQSDPTDLSDAAGWDFVAHEGLAATSPGLIVPSLFSAEAPEDEEPDDETIEEHTPAASAPTGPQTVIPPLLTAVLDIVTASERDTRRAPTAPAVTGQGTALAGPSDAGHSSESTARHDAGDIFAALTETDEVDTEDTVSDPGLPAASEESDEALAVTADAASDASAHAPIVEVPVVAAASLTGAADDVTVPDTSSDVALDADEPVVPEGVVEQAPATELDEDPEPPSARVRESEAARSLRASEPDDDLVEIVAAVAPAEVEAGTTSAAVPAIRVRGLSKSYGDMAAVQSVDLTIPARVFYGIVGPNGAGKTTTLSLIAGLVRPDRGHIEIGGRDIATESSAALKQIGVLPDNLRTFDRLTGAQLLQYYGALRRLPAATVAERARGLARAFDLTEALSRPVSDYSTGMRKKILLAGAMIHAPRVLILDEPFESVDPISSALIVDVLSAYVERGGTVVLTSHSLDFVERLCGSVAVIVSGHVLAAGPVDEVRGTLTLEERYVQLAGGLDDAEELEWLRSFSD